MTLTTHEPAPSTTSMSMPVGGPNADHGTEGRTHIPTATSISDGLIPAGPTTPLTHTVPREYVHRLAHSEVFLTSIRTTAPDTYALTAQWPRQHTFYSTYPHHHDPLILCETLRQSLPLIAHTAYDLPLSHKLGWEHLHYTLNPDALLKSNTPADIHISAVCTDIKRRRGQLISLTIHFTITHNGVHLATAHTRYHCHHPSLYTRLRQGRTNPTQTTLTAPPPTPPINPRIIHRTLPQDVTLTATPQPHQHQLRIDPTHPILFDHPLDHAPGMLLIEATRQATQTHHIHPQLPTSLTINFHRYVEYDSPTIITTHSTPDDLTSPLDPRTHTTTLTATQNDATAYSAVLTTQTLLEG
ncbi:ScbA/BarX family gamma-butyrolactone biosynthesis protein [Streptomyces purpureus]|uniref:Adhesin n=1 Tax=Streptomyces purpureus TaxID=1951 RepID=A0A918H130_9ACTN|nr:ScbA/BarX family gamma-butyrolactone biosynthesis protein [Streptomyces purpureus]GGT30530.1 adhesin [Streptomyces purpureus]